MDISSIDKVGNARLSNSPASTPIFVEEPASPAKSVHLETMEDQITGLPRSGVRAIDFFDDTSSDDENQVITRANAGQAPTPVIVPSKHYPTSSSNACYVVGSATPSEHVSQANKDQKGTPYATPTNGKSSDPSFLRLTSTPGINGIK